MGNCSTIVILFQPTTGLKKWVQLVLVTDRSLVIQNQIVGHFGMGRRTLISADNSFILRVLEAFDKADSHDSLFWRVRENDVTFFANCSDFFYWATADAEDILPEDVPLLEQTLMDLQVIDCEYYLSELFCARKRGMRPQGAAYQGSYGIGTSEARHLFDACGPERETDLWNPRNQEG